MCSAAAVIYTFEIMYLLSAFYHLVGLLEILGRCLPSVSRKSTGEEEEASNLFAAAGAVSTLLQSEIDARSFRNCTELELGAGAISSLFRPRCFVCANIACPYLREEISAVFFQLHLRTVKMLISLQSLAGRKSPCARPGGDESGKEFITGLYAAGCS